MNNTYTCQSYYDDNNQLQDCTCGKCDIATQMKKIVITEVVEETGTKWLMNIGRFNDESDIEIPESLAKIILAYMKPDKHGEKESNLSALIRMLPSRTRKLEYDEDAEKWRCWTMPYSVEATADTPEEAVKMVLDSPLLKGEQS